MDFRSFHSKFNSENSDNRSHADLKKTAEKYVDKSDEELLKDIKKAALEGKREGSFSDEKLRIFADQVSPMLNNEQRRRLQSVIDMLKD